MKDSRLSISRRVCSHIVRPIDLLICIFGITPGTSLVLKVFDKELPRVGRILSRSSTPSHFVRDMGYLCDGETHCPGIRWRASSDESPPASIRKTECPLAARLALCHCQYIWKIIMEVLNLRERPSARPWTHDNIVIFFWQTRCHKPPTCQYGAKDCQKHGYVSSLYVSQRG